MMNSVRDLLNLRFLWTAKEQRLDIHIKQTSGNYDS